MEDLTINIMLAMKEDDRIPCSSGPEADNNQ